MQPLDLKEFVWVSRETKESFIIIAITDYKDEDIVVYRMIKDRSKICVKTVADFVDCFEAIYEIT